METTKFYADKFYDRNFIITMQYGNLKFYQDKFYTKFQYNYVVWKLLNFYVVWKLINFMLINFMIEILLQLCSMETIKFYAGNFIPINFIITMQYGNC